MSSEQSHVRLSSIRPQLPVVSARAETDTPIRLDGSAGRGSVSGATQGSASKFAMLGDYG